LEHTGQIVASGGYVRNYNFPYIDMYYEVKEDHRKKGFGSLFTQELKREAYRLKRVPAARCNVKNNASKATLLKSRNESLRPYADWRCGFCWKVGSPPLGYDGTY
jgi:hypothetical protein